MVAPPISVCHALRGSSAPAVPVYRYGATVVPITWLSSNVLRRDPYVGPSSGKTRITSPRGSVNCNFSRLALSVGPGGPLASSAYVSSEQESQNEQPGPVQLGALKQRGRIHVDSPASPLASYGAFPGHADTCPTPRPKTGKGAASLRADWANWGPNQGVKRG